MLLWSPSELSIQRCSYFLLIQRRPLTATFLYGHHQFNFKGQVRPNIWQLHLLPQLFSRTDLGCPQQQATCADAECHRIPWWQALWIIWEWKNFRQVRSTGLARFEAGIDWQLSLTRTCDRFTQENQHYNRCLIYGQERKARRNQARI